MIKKNGPKNYLPPIFRELFTVLIKRDTDTFTTEKGCIPRLCQPHDPLEFSSLSSDPQDWVQVAVVALGLGNLKMEKKKTWQHCFMIRINNS